MPPQMSGSAQQTPATPTPPSPISPTPIAEVMPQTTQAQATMPPKVEHHINTAAIVSGALFIGLLIGAAGGYYGSKVESSIVGALNNPQQTSQDVEQAQQEQQAAQATAESYSDVDTNPLGDVQTNPFE